MNLTIPTGAGRQEVFKTVRSFLDANHLTIIDFDDTRPWGGFFVIHESQAAQFADLFFKDVPESKSSGSGKLSPKILIVEGNKRLSWQYHHRRAEIWKVISGRAGVITSADDQEGEIQLKKKDDVIILKQGERHRLTGAGQWGIIAEVWQHTDRSHPSDEDDIVRVQDDFGR